MQLRRWNECIFDEIYFFGSEVWCADVMDIGCAIDAMSCLGVGLGVFKVVKENFDLYPRIVSCPNVDVRTLLLLAL